MIKFFKRNKLNKEQEELKSEILQLKDKCKLGGVDFHSNVRELLKKIKKYSEIANVNDIFVK